MAAWAGTDPNDWREWYESFDEKHSGGTAATSSTNRRQQWYDAAAESYRYARPRYPERFLDDVLQKAGLLTCPNTNCSILEIGCGPGTLTSPLVQRGATMTSLDPSPAACALARQECAAAAENNNSKVTIHNTTFEDFDLNVQQQKKYNAVLAGTSFHWVKSAVACSKSAAALKSGGALILLWATPPRPSEDVCDYLQPIYERFHQTDLGNVIRRTDEYYRTSFEMFATQVDESGLFTSPSTVEMEMHRTTYSIDKYLALLRTLSPYIALEDETRQNLLRSLEDRLKERLGSTQELEVTNWFASQISFLRQESSSSSAE